MLKKWVLSILTNFLHEVPMQILVDGFISQSAGMFCFDYFRVWGPFHRWKCQCLANGLQPHASSLWIQCDQRNWQQNVLGVKELHPGLFPGGRSVTRIPFTQSESAGSKPVSASGPLCPHSHPLGPSACTVVPHSHPLGLCPWCCHHSSLCSALLQPCSPATVSPRPLGRALYVESITTFAHTCVVS